MSLTGTYAENVQYLIEMGEDSELANDPTATNILPKLDSERRPVIGFGYDLLSNFTLSSTTFATDLEAVGVSAAQVAALSAFLQQHATTPYSESALATLQGLVSIPTYADAVTLLQNSIVTKEGELTAFLTGSVVTGGLGIADIPPSNQRAALMDMWY